MLALSPAERLERLAQGQHGLVTVAQASALALSPRHLARSRTRRWQPLGSGLYRLAAMSPSWRQQLMAAVLGAGPGSVVSHRAAAVLQGFEGPWKEPVEMTVPPGRHPHLPGVIVHRSRQLARVDLETRTGIPVTTVTRSIIDLAAVAETDVVERVMEAALRARRTSLGLLSSRMAALGERGRPGIAAVRALLDSRGTVAATESEMESRFVQLLRQAGLPQGIRQYRVRDGTGPVARVDMAFPAQQVLVELDGWKTHGTPEALAGDLRRQNRIALALPGWVLLRFSWDDIVNQPVRTAAGLDRALSRCGSR